MRSSWSSRAPSTPSITPAHTRPFVVSSTHGTVEFPIEKRGEHTMKDATAKFFDELGRGRREPLLRTATGTLRFDLADAKTTERFLVAMKKGDVAVSLGNGGADCVVAVDRPLLNKIVRGETNAAAAV